MFVLFMSSAAREVCSGDCGGGEIILFSAVEHHRRLHYPAAGRGHHDRAGDLRSLPVLRAPDVRTALSTATENGGKAHKVEVQRHAGRYFC